MNIFVSIIIPTLGRVAEMDALLASIERQTHRDFEVIIVDQNASDLLDEIVARHRIALPIHHLKVCLRGAARARNYGTRFAKGEVLSFPDDDCELFPETIERALQTMKTSGTDIVFGRAADRDDADAVAHFARDAAFLSFEDHEKRFVEFTTFIKKSLMERFPFDENLGVGTFHGSEEGHDLVLRLLKARVPMFYSPDIVFFHPLKIATHRSAAEIRRVFTYRCGFARLCLKHKMHARLANRFVKVLLFLFYLSVFNRRKTRYYLAELLGLLAGAVVK